MHSETCFFPLNHLIIFTIEALVPLFNAGIHLSQTSPLLPVLEQQKYLPFRFVCVHCKREGIL